MRAILLNDTSTEGHYGCDFVIHNLTSECSKHGLSIVRRYTRKQLDSGDVSFDNISTAIINGEGTPHSGSMFLIQALRMIPDNIKIFLINTTFCKMYHEDLPYLLDRCSIISARESLSQAVLQKLTEKKVECVPDLIFLNKKNLVSAEIGYSDSVMLSLTDSLKSKRNFFPCCYSQGHPDLIARIQWMRSLKLFVTGRFHDVCLAAITGTPFLAFPSVAYKIEGLLHDMGLEELVVRSFEELKEKQKSVNFDRTVKKALKYAATAKKSNAELIERICKS